MVKVLLACLLLAAPSRAQDASSAAGMDTSIMERQDVMRREMEAKVKNEILDPVLGAGKAFVFADVELEVIAKKAEQTKEGLGVISKYKEKGASKDQADSEFLLPGIPKPRSVLGKDVGRPAASQGQQAQQGKGVQEVRYGLGTEVTRLQLTVIHDDTLPQAALKLARERMDDFLVPYKIRGTGTPTVVFKPTKFKGYNMLDDLKRPSVYLPLLYAALTLLFLLFLFGPLWSFFRKYVKALMEKPGAEVNIENKEEEGGGGGGGGGEEVQKQEGHQQIDMNFLQKEPEPPPEQDEDELMKKFEPFAYITEENLRKLVYYFILKKEDPWVIALVLSYVKVELSRQALSIMPVELQSRVALESLTVRQATREQIEAIDKEIKENVDFVMGGMERLAKMLEESDPATRNNIIEYLKTQKPEIYEHIRKVVLTFDTLVNFSDKDMQTLIRSVSGEDVARALSEAAPELSNKFFSNMSQGAVSAVKEILEYSSGVSRAQVEEARSRILDSVRALEAEGKVNFRQQGGQEVILLDGGLSSGDERRRKFESMGAAKPAEQPAAPAADPAKAAEAAQYAAAGAELVAAGRYQEGLQYLEYAVAANPAEAAPWQYLGSAYYALQRVDEALAAYERYAALANDPSVTQWLAGFKQQVGR